ncbi:MAG: tetratricopeptide repeat protein, partial [Acidobacteriota bacterium]
MNASRQFSIVNTIALTLLMALFADPALAQQAGAQRTGRTTKPAAATAEQHYEQGVNALRRNNPAQAAVSLRAAIRLKPDFAEAHNALGMALGQQGQADEALNAFREALRLRPDFAEAHANLGLALQQKGQLNEAILAFRAAIAAQANFAP